MSKGDIAKNFFEQGYNCSQSVLMAFSEDLGVDRVTAAKISCPLGGGVARTRNICGAVTGGLMAIGLVFSDGTGNSKQICYEKGQSFIKCFSQANGSCICSDLLGIDPKDESPVPEKRTNEYYKSRPCADLVKSAADILEEFLND